MADAKFRNRLRAGALTFCMLAVMSLQQIAEANARPLADTITVQADHAKLQRLDRPASTIIVGNPLIADATVEDGKLLVITGKNYGATNLIALDNDGRPIAYFKIHVRTAVDKKLSLYNGNDRESYSCAPRCERELLVSDAALPFKTIQKEIEDKTKLIENAGKQALQ